MSPSFDVSASWDEFYGEQEKAAIGEEVGKNYRAILNHYDAKNLGQVARLIYKYTSCGAAIGALVEDSFGGEWQYRPTELYDISAAYPVLKLSVMSIIEGVEQTTDVHIVDFTKEYEDEKAVVATWIKAVAAVEQEADQIWHETHGCDTCKIHFAIDPDSDYSPVWDQCPNCNGNGTIF